MRRGPYVGGVYEQQALRTVQHRETLISRRLARWVKRIKV